VNLLRSEETQEAVVVTHRGSVKRMNVSEVEKGTRAKRGVVTLKELKSNPHRIFSVKIVSSKDTVLLETENNVQETIEVKSLPKADRYSNGSLKIDVSNDGALMRVKVIPISNQD